jgi:hypothetical protein
LTVPANMPIMSCSERKCLERAYSEARAAFDAAYARLPRMLGLSLREGHERLDPLVGQARTALQRASELLYRHIVEHGCELTEASAGIEAFVEPDASIESGGLKSLPCKVKRQPWKTKPPPSSVSQSSGRDSTPFQTPVRVKQ